MMSRMGAVPFVALAVLTFSFSVSSCHARRATRPRLVVSVVLDQLGSWVLETHANQLDETGFLRTAMRRGTYHPRVRYVYATTMTAPGHASIYTGAPPRLSGIVANRVWDETVGKRRSTMDDGRSAVFGVESVFAGPGLLRVEGVADTLKQSSTGRARVVSLSNKDRSAILSGGDHPDAAVWYDHDARGFTTSSHYARALPSWIARFNRRHPVTKYLRPWTPLRPLEVDLTVGEGGWLGLAGRFPHHAARTRDPGEALLASPWATEHLLDLARVAVREFRLGEDSVADLLAISVSGTDYVGHVFGPDSVEYVDNLVRVDRMLGDFARELSATTDVSFVVTADHGVTPVVERARTRGAAGFRVEGPNILRASEAAAVRALGPSTGRYVDGFVPPFLHFAIGETDPRFETLLAAVTEGVLTVPGVRAAVDTRSIREKRALLYRDSLFEAVPSDTTADAYIVLSEGSAYDEDLPNGGGTSHGTPYVCDSDVPVLMFGVGVNRSRSSGKVEDALDQRRVASTIAALLGAPAPAAAHPEALPGIDPRGP